MSWEIKPSSGLKVAGNNLVPVKQTKAVTVRPEHANLPVTRGELEQVLSKLLPFKQIEIGGDYIDAEVIIRLVKRVTQQIGEYRDADSAYSHYVIPALRKARSDMLSDLEKHFHIKWRLVNGQSEFYK